MAELYLVSFIVFLIAGVLSHDRSVTKPPGDKFRYWDVSSSEDYTTTTFMG